ncbi:MAG: hypothetical protein A3A24_02145 [Candidatus Buchananbacteria bacterium RIFCSPLOWO2_01_FULL_46_12]|uniref:Uncharacterized protein n=2 Tax=Candidatus Buchananiibacteriota TaxID=1817903 RepID=A0A1G1YW22_9BACT|nr:MAG: hypothetical protein A2744_00950 [Candidatus Buchananbacteria bacterium RIFCSPHIGHO2_01_FULL_44_11]OGY55770.1 MAG: hypothetical protein A3A24_02145 [Candidatus Buchananbacteria bacterium RIFCSPLOWO2_01_FULL_46_12]
MKQTPGAYVIQLGQNGLLTLAIPKLAGHYVIVEQREGYLVISALDPEWENGSGLIASRGRQCIMLNSTSGGIPHV